MMVLLWLPVFVTFTTETMRSANLILHRAAMEEMGAHLLKRVEQTLQQCLSDSNLKLDDIASVEVVGGSTRIPAIKHIIEKVFKKVPSTTLNQDEAVARGCALQCAMLSPAFKVTIQSSCSLQCTTRSPNFITKGCCLLIWG